MRIIGGKYKGRIITPISGLKIRPTTDFARESLFNILVNRVDLESVSMLDLFSGTGAIGFEFSSRGAEVVHMIEKERKHITGIRQNIQKLGITNVKPVHIDVKAFLKTCKFKYDIVYADPPYDLDWLKDIPDLVIGSGIMKADGFLILEHPRSFSFEDHKYFFEHRNYGSVNFSFFSSSVLPE
ncbi:MAG: 16S rRNA (guanine(966)-N(2))-methyltransferase RsmD [Bacteroidales bacterium]|nr:16S rRNA (guanine(966)-N(2))-methyltransferase RsmD [Bacteroidales bacterium]